MQATYSGMLTSICLERINQSAVFIIISFYPPIYAPRIFRDAIQTSMYVSGLAEETTVPGGNPEAWGQHANCVHAGQRQESNPYIPIIC